MARLTSLQSLSLFECRQLSGDLAPLKRLTSLKSLEDLRLYMKRWHNEVGDVLAYVNDVLHPHGFEDIVNQFRQSAPDALRAVLMLIHSATFIPHSDATEPSECIH